jgi:hypothetical protein
MLHMNRWQVYPCWLYSKLIVGRIPPSITGDNVEERRHLKRWNRLENSIDALAEWWFWHHPGEVEREVGLFLP